MIEKQSWYNICSILSSRVVLEVKGGGNMQKRASCLKNDQEENSKRIIETYSPMVYRLAYSLVKSRTDAEDVHQEVFLRYLKYKPCFESKEHEKAWFLRVTTNQCKNLWKMVWRRRIVSLSEYEEDRVSSSLQGQEPGAEDNNIIAVVKTLPQKYRVVIHLFYYEELSVDEIARILALKPSNVRTQLTRARKKLGELLKEEI